MDYARDREGTVPPNYGLQPTGPEVECVGFCARHQVYAGRPAEPVRPASPQLNPGVRQPLGPSLRIVTDILRRAPVRREMRRMRVRTRLAVLLLGALVFALGCGGSDDGPTGPAPECDAPVSLSVGGGLTPVISWSPACTITQVVVNATASGDTVWFLVPIAPGQQLEGPVTYGSSTFSHRPLPGYGPDPLVAGEQYRVRLRQSEAPDGEEVVGDRTFIAGPGTP